MSCVRGRFPQLGMRFFHSHEAPLPGFPAFTHINEAITTAAHVLPPHAHRHFEFCYIHAGYATWSVGGERFRLKPGDVFVARPGEVHHGTPDPKRPNHNFAVGFDPGQLALPGSSRPRAVALGAGEVARAVDEARELSPFEGTLSERVIPGGQGAERLYRAILDELDALEARDTPAHRRLTLIQVQALLAELFVLFARLAIAHRERTAPPRLAKGPRHEIAELLAWLPTRLASPPPLRAMAARVGLSPAHFAVVFRREVGRTPLEHLTLLRMQAAAERLARGATVTDTALALGYASPQYFSAVYKHHHGTVPSAAQKARRP